MSCLRIVFLRSLTCNVVLVRCHVERLTQVFFMFTLSLLIRRFRANLSFIIHEYSCCGGVQIHICLIDFLTTANSYKKTLARASQNSMYSLIVINICIIKNKKISSQVRAHFYALHGNS